jgi:threonine dehydratase
MQAIENTATGSRLSVDRIAEASRTIDPVFLASPQFVCEPLADRLGCRLTLKVETTNPVRSFKGRGADYFVRDSVAAGDRRPMICASAGNFGQGMAYACRARGLPLTVVLARTANPLKVARLRALGATVVEAGEDFEEAKDAAHRLATRAGLRFVEDGGEPRIAEGAGSIAVELLARGDAFDCVVVPIGDGALINGMARWVKAVSSGTRVVGVCSRGAPAVRDAWRGDQREASRGTAPVDTIADGIAVRVPVPSSVEELRAQVDDIVLVDDRSLVLAMRLALEHAGLVVEPAGGAGLAALLEHRAAFEGTRVATVLTGGNVTEDPFRGLIGPSREKGNSP